MRILLILIIKIAFLFDFESENIAWINNAKYELVTNVCFNDDKSAEAVLNHSQLTSPTTSEALPQVLLKHSQPTTNIFKSGQ